MELAGRLIEGLAFGQNCLGAAVDLDLVGALQHVTEIMRPRMAMRGRAPAWWDVEGDHHYFAARDIAKRLLHELIHLGSWRLLLRRNGAEVKGDCERAEAENTES